MLVFFCTLFPVIWGAKAAVRAYAHVLPALLRITGRRRQHQRAQQQHRLLHSSLDPFKFVRNSFAVPQAKQWQELQSAVVTVLHCNRSDAGRRVEPRKKAERIYLPPASHPFRYRSRITLLLWRRWRLVVVARPVRTMRFSIRLPHLCLQRVILGLLIGVSSARILSCDALWMSIIFARLSALAIDVSSRSAFDCFRVSSSIAFTCVTWSGVRFSFFVRNSNCVPSHSRTAMTRTALARAAAVAAQVILRHRRQCTQCASRRSPKQLLAKSNLRNIVIFIGFHSPRSSRRSAYLRWSSLLLQTQPCSQRTSSALPDE